LAGASATGLSGGETPSALPSLEVRVSREKVHAASVVKRGELFFICRF
jgi:hypothetical protein